MTATERRWAERVRAWRSSGKTAAEFSDGEGYAGATLKWWASRLGRGGSKTRPKAQIAMVRVVRKAPATAPTVVVEVGAARVVVHAGFDAELLAAVVTALAGTQ